MKISETLREDLEYTFSKLSLSELEKMYGSTIVITGCAGFLGYYFCQFFHHYSDILRLKKVVCLDNFMLGHPGWIDEIADGRCFTVKDFDVIKNDIKDVPEAAEADFVIHMASIASPVFYRKYPIETLDANVWGLRRLLDFYAERSIKGLLFYSSSEIYGDPSPDAIPTDEEYRGFVSATGPRACYDESKRFGETMCMLFAQKFGMPIGVARPFNNYGPGMKLNDKRVPADFAKNVIEGNDLIIRSNGAPTRTFCYIADAIAGYFKILLHGRYDYFNIGIEKPEISISELAEIYRATGAELLDYKGKVVFEPSEEKDYLTNNPQRRCPKIEKARRVLGYEPEISVQQGVCRFLKFIQESTEEHYIW